MELAASVVSAVDVIEARKAAIGDGTEVRRLLPTRELRTIGAWCFLDHYGPDDVSAGPGMQVPPHPHIGLQTASWLFDGLVLHRDSLGSEQLIRPGELNLMTSGRAIAHSEESPPQRPPLLHGVQLWIALPQERRFGDPDFAHHADLPVLDTGDGVRITVVAGEFGGERSPAAVYTPLVGLEVVLPGASQITLPGHGRLRVRGDNRRRTGGHRLPGDRGLTRPDRGRRAGAPARRGTDDHAVVGRPVPVLRSRRGAATREARHVVELRRANARGDCYGTQRVGKWRVWRGARVRRRSAGGTTASSWGT